jgi:hypothetical protein
MVVPCLFDREVFHHFFLIPRVILFSHHWVWTSMLALIRPRCDFILISLLGHLVDCRFTKMVNKVFNLTLVVALTTTFNTYSHWSWSSLSHVSDLWVTLSLIIHRHLTIGNYFSLRGSVLSTSKWTSTRWQIGGRIIVIY